MSILYNFFGLILRFIYDWVGNYGVSIVVFALFAKVITLPLAIKQVKSSQIMGALSPLQTQIQKKYASNKEKMNAELQKLYAKYRYNPLSGCFPLLIQLPILIGLYGVIRNPTLYVFTEAEYALVSKSFLWVKDLTISTFQTYAETGFSVATFLSLIIPLVAIGFTVIQQEQTSKNMSQQQGQKSMLIMTIVMIGYMTLSYQQALGLYWGFQTILGVVMTIVMFRFFPVSLEEMEKNAADKNRLAQTKNPNKFIEQRKTYESADKDTNRKTQKDYIQQRPGKQDKQKNN